MPRLEIIVTTSGGCLEGVYVNAEGPVRGLRLDYQRWLRDLRRIYSEMDAAPNLEDAAFSNFLTLVGAGLCADIGRAIATLERHMPKLVPPEAEDPQERASRAFGMNDEHNPDPHADW